jgi:uncharacterized protein (DUF1697 family)
MAPANPNYAAFFRNVSLGQLNNPSRARELLMAGCGLEQPAFLRSVHYLAGLVRAEPFAAVAQEDVDQRSITFMQPGSLIQPAAPLESARRDILFLRFTGGESPSVSRMIAGSAGDATAFLEKTFKVPVTTGNWNTIVRLTKKYA